LENNKFNLIKITPDSSSEDIIYMQEIFKNINLYSGKID
jgi:hypothetical protein